MYLRLLVLAVIICMVPAFSQVVTPGALTGAPAVLDGAFQVKAFPNLVAGDSVMNICNDGANGTGTNPFAIAGNICVGVYVFDATDEQEVACCQCTVTPNACATLSARQLISKTLTPGAPPSIMVKLITYAAPCNIAGAVPSNLFNGMTAWGTNIHAAPVGGSNIAGTFAVTETPFTPATLSAAELLRATQLCGFIGANGSGFGVCPGCVPGAAGPQGN